MPELPEVETVRRGLAPRITGRRLQRVDLHVKALRFPFPENFAHRLSGHRITGVHRRGKYLLIAMHGSRCVLIHLGMTGKFRLYDADASAPARAKHDHVSFHLDDGARVIFNDTRRFGFMDILSGANWRSLPPLSRLGPEADTCTGHDLATALTGRALTIKAALMDQRIIAGLGNIYACEALFRARLSVHAPAGSVATADIARLAAAVRDVLRQAIAAGGSSIRDYANADGRLGYFQNSLDVYGRAGQPCPVCATLIAREMVCGRASFYCPSCQTLRALAH